MQKLFYVVQGLSPSRKHISVHITYQMKKFAALRGLSAPFLEYTSQSITHLSHWNVFDHADENKADENTLMFPSADPLMKQSSVGSTASALTGESWAWKLCRWCLCGSSNTLIQPFLPPVISSCCLGAIESAVAPDSWQQKAAENPVFCRGGGSKNRGKRTSLRHLIKNGDGKIICHLLSLLNVWSLRKKKC